VHDKISIIDNEVISLWVSPSRRMIHHVMKAYCHGDKFRETLTRGADALERYRAIKWLSDDRANGALPTEDTDWAEQTWFPKVKAAGWKYWAVVQPTKVIGQLNLARLVKRYAELGINAQIFSEPDEAIKWLDRVAWNRVRIG
jgi:hypothetical protein